MDQRIMRFYAKSVIVFELDSKKVFGDIIHHLEQSLAVALSEIPDFAVTVEPVPATGSVDGPAEDEKSSCVKNSPLNMIISEHEYMYVC